MFTGKSVKIIAGFTLVLTWLVWDFSQAGGQLNSLYKSYRMEADFGAVSAGTTTVSIVRSNDANIANPTSVNNSQISYQTIEDMTRESIRLAGGLGFIHAGDMVLLKPNIVDADPSGNGEVTDVRVVKALIKIIGDAFPGNIEIVVGEGSPVPIDYELEYDEYYHKALWKKLWDTTGYQDLLSDPVLAGINFRLSNLNCTMPGPGWKRSDGWPPDSAWQDLVLVDVPGGGLADPQEGKYWLHKDVIDADVFITVPVMKIHTTVMTAAIKNQIGIAPSTIYGFWKQMGVPQNNYKYRLVHQYRAPKWWTHEEVVDLANLAGIDFAVVDAIGCLEREKDARWDGSNFVRMNTIIAGVDPVAVDNVCSRLMGLNPDDVEHITLAEKVGLGTNDPEKIIIKGADLEKTKRRFKKSYFEGGQFGQGNRTWLLNGVFPITGISTPIDHEFIRDEANVEPKPGQDGWGEAVYFTDNRVDLKDYFELSSGDKVASYAFCYFDAPKNQKAELWIGSDEALKIYINGDVAYRYNGTRSFPGEKYTNAKVTVDIKAGKNTLLIKSLQKLARYDFCLNICEPEKDGNYDGNRVFGLKFMTSYDSAAIEQQHHKTVANFKMHNAYPNPFNNTTIIDFDLPHSGRVSADIYNVAGRHVRRLYDGTGTMGQNSIQWHGKNDFGKTVPSGMYLLRLTFEQQAATQKLFLIK